MQKKSKNILPIAQCRTKSMIITWVNACIKKENYLQEGMHMVLNKSYSTALLVIWLPSGLTVPKKVVLIWIWLANEGVIMLLPEILLLLRPAKEELIC